MVSTVDLSPTRAFYASNGKARALYREIMNNLHIKTCQDRSCLEIVLQKWITRLREEWEPENGPLVFEILQAIERTFDTFKVPLMAYDFGKAVAAYAQGMLNEDREQKIQALRWLRAETDTKTEAKKNAGHWNDHQRHELVRRFENVRRARGKNRIRRPCRQL